MNGTSVSTTLPRSWVRENLFLGLPFREYAGTLMTPGNFIAGLILLVGLPVMAYRFVFGLGAATNMSQTNPWGIWIGIDMLSGVALAAGGYTLAGTVYLFGLERYAPVLRPAVLTGFLGYLFAVVGLCADLGRPWRLPYPVFYSYGVTSVMFEVAWCVMLYLTVQFLEICPAIFEWLGWHGARRRIAKVTIGLVVFGIILSTLHQSALGALFLMAPGKLHPLWYTPFIGLFFFISSIIAGLTMVIFESSVSHKVFHHQVEPGHEVDLEGITLGLGKAASVVLFTYFFLKLIGLADGGHWRLLATPYGAWFGVEVLGFVLLPCLMLAVAVRTRRVWLVRLAAVIAVVGVVLNRVNVSLVAFNWNAAERYFPSWMEIVVTITIITLFVLTFRWMVLRMPVLRPHPEYPNAH
jgi:Ni/Fe-hydrogenase subunit HybB-like protein